MKYMNHPVFGISYVKECVLGFALLLAIAILPGCSGIFGGGASAKFSVDENVVVTDLSSNKRLSIDTLSDSSHVIRLQKGKRYALRVEKDSLTSYVFLDPYRDPITVLNVFNYGLGSVVDHFTNSFYKYDEEYIPSPLKRNAVAPPDRARIEDSLRARATPVVPTSVVYDRPYGIVVPYGSFGIEGPGDDGAWLGGFGSSAGIGIEVVPWLMPVYERGITEGQRMGDLHNMSAVWEAFGIHVQEPVLGIFASFKYGTMTAVGNGVYSYWHERPKPDFKVDLRFYSFSVGIYGQWGRMEYRYRRNTSWNSHYLIPDLSGNYNGLHYTLHIRL